MKFSLNALKRLVNLDSLSVDAIVSRLTFAGFEVEEVSSLASGTNLVIGKIISLENHPKSTHLHLLKVDCGEKYGVLNIVCGAPNVSLNMKVIVALVGAKLDKISLTIKESVILGYKSQGMCCSLLELGVDSSLLDERQKNGIEEIDDSVEIGREDVLSLLSLDDIILDINVLPNRIDCLSYINLARELSALFEREMNPLPSFSVSTIKKEKVVSSLTPFCEKISLLRVKDIRIKKQLPSYIKEVLQASGIRSISPIVDLGNYLMLLTGQPINMYDNSKIEGKVQVSSSYQGDFISFDNKSYQLKEGDILISDEKKPLCLAGIIASSSAMIDDKSDDILIEFASFYHANIRRTCKRLGLSSFSSNLFAKGVNPFMIDESISLCISLLDEFFSSYDIVSLSSFSSLEEKRNEIEFSISDCKKRIGVNYTQEEVEKLFSLYHIGYEKKDDIYHLYPPKHRPDLKESCDIQEELFRFYGSSRVPLNLIDFPVTKGESIKGKDDEDKIRDLLVSRGLYEVVSYTLIDEKMDKEFKVFSSDKESYKVKNPMTKDHEIIRNDILSSLYAVVKYNLSHFNRDFQIFEISDVDIKGEENKKILSIALVGNKVSQDNYHLSLYDFFDIKGLLSAILNRLGIMSNRYSYIRSDNSFFNPYCSADLLFNKKKVGTFGKIHPSMSKDNIFLLELDLSYLISLSGRDVRYKMIDTYPLVRRDLSFYLDKDVSYKEIKDAILKDKTAHLKDVLFFDDFISEDNKRYIGVSLYMSKEDSSLLEDEINSTLQRAINAVEKKLSLSIRR